MHAGRRARVFLLLLACVPPSLGGCRNVGQELLEPALELREVQYRDALVELNKSKTPKPAAVTPTAEPDAEAKKHSFSFKWPSSQQEDPAWWNRRLPPAPSPLPAIANSVPLPAGSTPWEPVTLKGAVRLGHPVPHE